MIHAMGAVLLNSAGAVMAVIVWEILKIIWEEITDDI